MRTRPLNADFDNFEAQAEISHMAVFFHMSLLDDMPHVFFFTTGEAVCGVPCRSRGKREGVCRKREGRAEKVKREWEDVGRRLL